MANVDKITAIKALRTWAEERGVASLHLGYTEPENPRYRLGLKDAKDMVELILSYVYEEMPVTCPSFCANPRPHQHIWPVR